jgi:hypothetical protein
MFLPPSFENDPSNATSRASAPFCLINIHQSSRYDSLSASLRLSSQSDPWLRIKILKKRLNFESSAVCSYAYRTTGALSQSLPMLPYLSNIAIYSNALNKHSINSKALESNRPRSESMYILIHDLKECRSSKRVGVLTLESRGTQPKYRPSSLWSILIDKLYKKWTMNKALSVLLFGFVVLKSPLTSLIRHGPRRRTENSSSRKTIGISQCSLRK